MDGHRIRVGIAVGLLGLGLSAGTASAQTFEGSSTSGGSNTSRTPPKRSAEVLPASETQTPPAEAPVLALTDEAPAAAAAPAASGAELPFTGGDVAGMLVMGAAAVGIGSVMVRRSKVRQATTA